MKKIIIIMITIVSLFSFSSCTSRTTTYNITKTPSPATETPNEEEKSFLPDITPQATEVQESTGPTSTPVTYSFTGYSFCIINASTGEMILGENAFQKNYIASITKLLTVMTALDYLKETDYVEVGEGWLSLFTEESGIDGYGLHEGSKYLVSDLIKLAMVRSAGDAAVTLEKAVEEKTGLVFLDLMNAKAQEFGMTSSHFDNVIGLDIGNGYTENYSTAADSTKLMLNALNYQSIMEACSGKTMILEDKNEIPNSCALLANGSRSDNYSILGGKTGATNASGTSLTVACKNSKTGEIYIVVYLHGQNMTLVMREIKQMMEYVCATNN